MAILSAQERAELRQKVAAKLSTVGYTKPQVNAALQGIEDWFEANRASLSTAINAATTPLGYTFSAAEKKLLVAFWLLQKFGREGV